MIDKIIQKNTKVFAMCPFKNREYKVAKKANAKNNIPKVLINNLFLRRR